MLLTLTTAAASICQGAADMTDNSFGVRGEVVTRFTSQKDSAQAIAVQPDGKIIVGGASEQRFCYGNFTDFALARYNQNGSLDGSFGSGGKVITSFSYQNGNNEVCKRGAIYSLALQPDGKIIAAGNSSDGVTLVRYNPDGSMDNSFGVNGKVTTGTADFSGYAFGVAIQSDGRIVVAGDMYVPIYPRSHIGLIRYNTDGSLDNSFGTDGKVFTIFNYEDRAAELVIQPDGKIVVGGSSKGENSTANFTLTRYNSDGTIDALFGSGGIVTTVFTNKSSQILSIALQSDNKIAAVGISSDSTNFYPALARYNTNGSLDTTFGVNGKILETNYPSSNIQSVAIQADGKIVTAGAAPASANIFRYNSDGTPDESFGVLGRALGKTSSYASAVAIQPDGNILAAGFQYQGIPDTDFWVARFKGGQGRSIAKFDFDGDGKSDISVFRPSEGVWYLNQSTDGMAAARFGTATDKLVPADFDGDGKTDIAVYRSGIWYLLRSQAGFTAAQFGDANDIPMPADFDGDGKAEFAVFRPSNAYWYFLNPINNEFTAIKFGQPGDKPITLDYSPDGKIDFGVYRNGTWEILISDIFERPRYYKTFEFGAVEDIPIPIEYGGGVAVFRPSNATWYFRGVSAEFTGQYSQIKFGLGTDIPVPADYDGDGKTDVAVFRNGTWYVNRSQRGLTGVNFGASDDKPISDVLLP